MLYDPHSPRNWLYLKMKHAFGHSHPGGDHNHLNLEGFMRALEAYIDDRVKDEMEKARGRDLPLTRKARQRSKQSKTVS
jgi:hypothetical protein